MQIIKRLLIGIPTILAISSIVFILSKIMPGTSGAYLLEDHLAMNSLVESEARDKIYGDYLKKTGQDKPLFYFKIASLAEPDTLYKIYPVYNQELVKRLCFAYGDWSLVREYYLALQNFKRTAENLLNSDAVQAPNFFNAEYYSAIESEDIQSLLSQTQQLVAATENEALQTAFFKLHHSFTTMESNSNAFRKYIPAVFWHGGENQYHHWLANLLKGDMGVSLRNQRPVLSLIKEALGITLLMTITSVMAAWLISILLAVGINLLWGNTLRKPVLGFLYVLDTFPLFLLSFLVLIIFSSERLNGLLPSFGLGNYSMIDNHFLRLLTLLNHLTLPVFCMTLVLLPYLTGQIDRAIKDVGNFEYIKTARAKGLSETRVLVKHILRNTSSTLITLFTENLPALLAGALVVEVIFAVPGMGRLLIGAVNARDYPVVLGIVILVAIVKILSNILADILYKVSDPRVKLSE